MDGRCVDPRDATARRPRMPWTAVMSRNGNSLILARTRSVLLIFQSWLTMVRNQARTRRSGGFSRREARRGGNTRRVGKGNCRPTVSGSRRSHAASAAVCSRGRTEGGFGSAGSPHGADFTHGLGSAAACWAPGAAADGGTFDPWGPQQQDRPGHPSPHLQLRVRGSPSKLRAAETEAAETL